jgi:hypothetical protein
MENFEYNMIFKENDFDSALDKCIESGLKKCYEGIELIIFKHRLFNDIRINGFVTYDTTEHGIFIGHNTYGDKC